MQAAPISASSHIVFRMRVFECWVNAVLRGHDAGRACTLCCPCAVFALCGKGERLTNFLSPQSLRSISRHADADVNIDHSSLCARVDSWLYASTTGHTVYIYTSTLSDPHSLSFAPRLFQPA